MKKLALLWIGVCLSWILYADTASHDAFEYGLSTCAYFKTISGSNLRYAHFKTPAQVKRGSICFVQGRGTVLEMYGVLVAELIDRGFDVWTYDLTGQGGSSRQLESDAYDEMTARCMQHIDDFNLYRDDLHDFVEGVFKKEVDGPRFLTGYSTGGHVALRYLQDNQGHDFDAAWMLSPLLTLNAGMPMFLLQGVLTSASWFSLLDRYVPGKGHEDPIFMMPFEENPYTSDPEGYAQLKALCEKYKHWMMGAVSLGWVKAALESIEKLWKNEALQNLTLPILIATGGSDSIVDISRNSEFSTLLPNAIHRFYADGRHELFRENPAIVKELWQALDDFFEIVLREKKVR